MQSESPSSKTKVLMQDTLEIADKLSELVKDQNDYGSPNRARKLALAKTKLEGAMLWMEYSLL
jgi:hypothetical protein